MVEDTTQKSELSPAKEPKARYLLSVFLKADGEKAVHAGSILTNRMLGNYEDAKEVGEILRNGIAGDSYIEDKEGIILRMGELSPLKDKSGTNPSPVTILLFGAATTFNEEAFNSLLKYTAIDGERDTTLRRAFDNRGGIMSSYVDAVKENWGENFQQAESNLNRINDLVAKHRSS